MWKISRRKREWENHAGTRRVFAQKTQRRGRGTGCRFKVMGGRTGWGWDHPTTTLPNHQTILTRAESRSRGGREEEVRSAAGDHQTTKRPNHFDSHRDRAAEGDVECQRPNVGEMRKGEKGRTTKPPNHQTTKPPNYQAVVSRRKGRRGRTRMPSWSETGSRSRVRTVLRWWSRMARRGASSRARTEGSRTVRATCQ